MASRFKCMVKGCPNMSSTRKLKLIDPTTGNRVSFHRFPSRDLKRRQKWIEFCDRGVFEPNFWEAICSIHFPAVALGKTFRRRLVRSAKPVFKGFQPFCVTYEIEDGSPPTILDSGNGQEGKRNRMSRGVDAPTMDDSTMPAKYPKVGFHIEPRQLSLPSCSLPMSLATVNSTHSRKLDHYANVNYPIAYPSSQQCSDHYANVNYPIAYPSSQQCSDSQHLSTARYPAAFQAHSLPERVIMPHELALASTSFLLKNVPATNMRSHLIGLDGKLEDSKAPLDLSVHRRGRSGCGHIDLATDISHSKSLAVRGAG